MRTRTLALAAGVAAVFTGVYLWQTQARHELGQRADVMFSRFAEGITIPNGLARAEEQEYLNARVDALDEEASKAVSRLLAEGADPNSIDDRFGRTLLGGYAANGAQHTVLMLLRAGADLNLKGADGKTALMWAALNGDSAMVRMLLEAGADARLRCTAQKLPSVAVSARELAEERLASSDSKEWDEDLRSGYRACIAILRRAEAGG